MFWDEQNWKIIRSRKITFNEQVVYKNRSSAKLVGIELEPKKYDFVNLDEVQEHEALIDSHKGKKMVEVELDV
jgi:hypothetical protein